MTKRVRMTAAATGLGAASQSQGTIITTAARVSASPHPSARPGLSKKSPTTITITITTATATVPLRKPSTKKQKKKRKRKRKKKPLQEATFHRHPLLPATYLPHALPKELLLFLLLLPHHLASVNV